MGCCLAPPARPVAPDGRGQYLESHERSVEFRAYSWSDAEWVCHSCHAVWVVEPPSDAQRDDGVLQVSRHEGGQRVFWLTDAQGCAPIAKSIGAQSQSDAAHGESFHAPRGTLCVRPGIDLASDARSALGFLRESS